MAAQLERLNHDIIQLDKYINKVKKRGQNSLVKKLVAKKSFLMSYLAEVQQT